MRSTLPPLIRFANFEVNLRTGELRREGSKVRLQEQPFSGPGQQPASQAAVQSRPFTASTELVTLTKTWTDAMNAKDQANSMVTKLGPLCKVKLLENNG